MKIVSFVSASSNSGKTTLMEKIVKIMKSRGLSVSVIKHASAGFELDRPGKDSRRFQLAGADSVVIAGAGKMAVIKKMDQEPLLDELLAAAGDADVVLYEGFKGTAMNKIEVFRDGISGKRPLCLNDKNFVALVADGRHPVNIPQFDLNDAKGVAEFILKEIQNGI